MKNVILAFFNEKSQSYEALSELKSGNYAFEPIAAGVIANNNGNLEIKDGFDLAESEANWATGGLIGGLVGILGGPVGILLGSGLGMTIGSGFDLDELSDNESILREVATHLKPATLALIIIVEETEPTELNVLLKKIGAHTITRNTYVAIQAEIYQHQEIEQKLAADAQYQMRQEKKVKWKAMAEAKQQELNDKLHHLRHKKF